MALKYPEQAAKVRTLYGRGIGLQSALGMGVSSMNITPFFRRHWDISVQKWYSRA